LSIVSEKRHRERVIDDEAAPVADGLVHELGRDRRVDTTRHGANDLTRRADEFPDALDLLVNELLLRSGGRVQSQ